VATDDQRIVDAVRSFDGEATMTSPEHPSGTDRIAEVVRGLDGKPDDIVLNVQGDEPEIEPAYLDRLVERLAADATCAAGTLACPFPPDCDPRDPNCVKVVCDRRQMALYFSRALIPYRREADASATDGEWLLHLGVYAYRRAFLLDFASWETSTLERVEGLEQLRVLDNGYAMAVAIVPRACPGINTPDEYEQFVVRHRSRARPLQARPPG
jgi:3-deoxy-manno-octulosonate cytidylyltransferase (CMP-KDO synthetase)